MAKNNGYKSQDVIIQGGNMATTGGCTGGTQVKVTYDNAALKRMTVTGSKTIRERCHQGQGPDTQWRQHHRPERPHHGAESPLVWGGDAIYMQGTNGGSSAMKKIWLDHIKISRVGRQFITTNKASTDSMTISNSDFDGNTDYSATCDGHHYWSFIFYGVTKFSMLNNYIHGTSGRSPKIGGDSAAKVVAHVANNFWGNNTGHSFEIGANAWVLAEGNYFSNTRMPLYTGTNGALYAASSNDECSSYLGRSCVANTLIDSGSFDSRNGETALKTIKGVSTFVNYKPDATETTSGSQQQQQQHKSNSRSRPSRMDRSSSQTARSSSLLRLAARRSSSHRRPAIRISSRRSKRVARSSRSSSRESWLCKRATWRRSGSRPRATLVLVSWTKMARVHLTLAAALALIADCASAFTIGSPEGLAAGTTGGAGNGVPDLERRVVTTSPRTSRLTFDFRGTEGPPRTGCRPDYTRECMAKNNGYKSQDVIIQGGNMATTGGCTGGTQVKVTYDNAALKRMTVTGSKTIRGIGKSGQGPDTQWRQHHRPERPHHGAESPLVWGGDAIYMQGTNGGSSAMKKIWLDHIKISRVGRQFITTNKASTDSMTISNSDFDGNTDYSATCDGHHYWSFIFYGVTKFSMLNNYIHGTSGRSPKIGGDSAAKVVAHVANNFWGNNTGHSFEIGANAWVLAEGNYFSNTKMPYTRATTELCTLQPTATSAPATWGVCAREIRSSIAAASSLVTAGPLLRRLRASLLL
ncbi:Pectin lyase fold [Phytophthora cactorum]|nr:Pectin lyase fold [Phytophthora cactorum]